MRRGTMVGAAVAALALAGCSLTRPTPEVRYYTLALSGAPSTRVDAPVRVGAITSDQPYATERMAYRRSPYRLDYYTFHRWAADPRNLIRTAARDYLERVAPASGSAFEIEGNIRRLEEVDEEAGWHGALALDLRVARGGTIILERTYDESEPAESRQPEAVAAAVSRALQRILDHVLTDLRELPGAATTAPSAGVPQPSRTGR